jgi:hypothetical protein
MPASQALHQEITLSSQKNHLIIYEENKIPIPA